LRGYKKVRNVLIRLSIEHCVCDDTIKVADHPFVNLSSSIVLQFNKVRLRFVADKRVGKWDQNY
jgi:hypothetical protein